MELKFLKVEFEHIVRYGTDVAVFVAYLKFVERNRPKDDYGYFCFDAKYSSKGLLWDRNKLHYVRRKAVQLDLIDYIGGMNQNAKPRYKLKV